MNKIKLITLIIGLGIVSSQGQILTTNKNENLLGRFTPINIITVTNTVAITNIVYKTNMVHKVVVHSHPKNLILKGEK